jgi:S-DNA-T family DNA segregation ATPase FtsK/SpoIIIE
MMPYALSLSQKAKKEINSSYDFFIDRFIKIEAIKFKSVFERITCRDLQSFTITYKNFIAIDIDSYKESIEAIGNYLLGANHGYEIKVYAHKNKQVQLYFYKLPTKYGIDVSVFKPEKVFLGMGEKGLFYKDITRLDHNLTVAESGSGKSNFLQLKILNYIANYHYFKKIYMIDLKGGVELKRYEHLDKIEFVSDIQKLDVILDNVLLDLKETQQELLETNKRKLDSYIMILFDEIGAISVYPDKKLKESIFNKLALISMQGRASGILLDIYAQKIDAQVLSPAITNNLQTKVLGRTTSDYAINLLVDRKEFVRENITAIEVSDFSKGRFIYKNGDTSDKTLIQCPFIPDKLIEQFLHLDIKEFNYHLSTCKHL